jgi:hypothetical protein
MVAPLDMIAVIMFSRSHDSANHMITVSSNDVEVVIKCKTLPRWFAGTRALDGGWCEQKVSRYCRCVSIMYLQSRGTLGM